MRGPKAPFVVRSEDVPEYEAAYPPPFDAEKLSFGRDLGRAAGSRSLGAWRERLPPGRRTSFTHAHLREEELVYVLAGTPSARVIEGDTAREILLHPGDLVVFPAGTGLAHTIVNRSTADADLLVVGERRPGERAWYPEDRAFWADRVRRTPDRAWEDVDGPMGDARPPAMRIVTERLLLRPWDPVDTCDLLAAQEKSRDHLLPWMPWAKTLATPDELLARIVRWQGELWADGDAVYGMFEPDGRIVGSVGLHRRVGPAGLEIGYWIAADREGRGYVTEAAAAVSRVAFDALGMRFVEIRCHPDNTRSAAVPRRLGFTHEVTLRARIPDLDGELTDVMVWSLHADAPAAEEVRERPIRAFDALGRRLL